MRAAALVLLSLALPCTAFAQRIVDRPEGIVETHRDVDVELVHGMALVTTRIGVRNDTDTPREVRVRVPAPAGALAGLRVCSGRACRDGAPSNASAYEVARVGRAFSPEPAALARMYGWRRMDVVDVEVAPVVRGRDFEITVQYTAPTRVVEGVVTIDLPPQDSDDPRDPAVTIEARAADLEDPRVDGQPGRVTRPILPDANRPMCEPDPRDARITARLPSGAARALAWSVRCSSQRCVRYRVATGPVAPRARDVVVLLDASPSSRGVPEETRRAALDALLASLAPDSRVTRVVYAREAALLDETPRAPADVPRELALPLLGNRTLFERAWALARDRLRGGVDPLVAIVGDAAIATTTEAHAAMDELVASGVQLAVIELAPRETPSMVRDAIDRTLGILVEAESLDAQTRIHAIAMPVVDPDLRIGGRSLGPIRAGQDRVEEQALEDGGPTPALIAFGRSVRPTAPPGRIWQRTLASRVGNYVGDDILVAATPAQVAAARASEVAPRGAGLDPRVAPRIARMPVIRGACGWNVRVRGSVSREALMRVRRRLDPALRMCFREARQGRPGWSATVMLRLVTHFGELIHVSVPSTTEPTLGACLAEAVERFEDLPYSDTVVAASFRFVARPHERTTHATPLAPDVEAVLEAIHVE